MGNSFRFANNKDEESTKKLQPCFLFSCKLHKLCVFAVLLNINWRRYQDAWRQLNRILIQVVLNDQSVCLLSRDSVHTNGNLWASINNNYIHSRFDCQDIKFAVTTQ